MSSDRHQPKQYEEHKDNCQYCRRTSVWQQIGNEKVCSQCGTRVYSPALVIPSQSTSVSRLNR
ncbi:MAG: hypothetical protein IT321_06840 [Anaerolineae bacterium]|nr:hypothetical protein [Anaerolineae bacterium]